jgi:hypothetical protein
MEWGAVPVRWGAHALRVRTARLTLPLRVTPRAARGRVVARHPNPIVPPVHSSARGLPAPPHPRSRPSRPCSALRQAIRAREGPVSHHAPPHAQPPRRGAATARSGGGHAARRALHAAPLARAPAARRRGGRVARRRVRGGPARPRARRGARLVAPQRAGAAAGAAAAARPARRRCPLARLQPRRRAPSCSPTCARPRPCRHRRACQVGDALLARYASLLPPDEAARAAEAADAATRKQRLLARALARCTLARYLPGAHPSQVRGRRRAAAPYRAAAACSRRTVGARGPHPLQMAPRHG